MFDKLSRISHSNVGLVTPELCKLKSWHQGVTHHSEGSLISDHHLHHTLAGGDIGQGHVVIRQLTPVNVLMMRSCVCVSMLNYLKISLVGVKNLQDRIMIMMSLQHEVVWQSEQD